MFIVTASGSRVDTNKGGSQAICNTVGRKSKYFPKLECVWLLFIKKVWWLPVCEALDAR